MYECPGICASGFKCTRDCFLNSDGYCHDHKNQSDTEIRNRAERILQFKIKCEIEKRNHAERILQFKIKSDAEFFKSIIKLDRIKARKQRSIIRLNVRLNSEKDTLGKWKPNSWYMVSTINIQAFRKWLPKENLKNQKSYVESIQRLENRLDSMSEIIRSMKEDLEVFQQE